MLHFQILKKGQGIVEYWSVTMKITDKTIQIYSSWGKLQTVVCICYLINSEG